MFVESLRRFPKECARMDLTEAYKRAKPMFDGRLEHTFVVLKDEHVVTEQAEKASGSNRVPIGKKRGADEDKNSGGKSSKKLNKSLTIR